MQDLVKVMVQFGWMMWPVVELSQDYLNAQAVAGVYITVTILKTLVLSVLVRLL